VTSMLQDPRVKKAVDVQINPIDVDLSHAPG
jgi:hypothetical protein